MTHGRGEIFTITGWLAGENELSRNVNVKEQRETTKLEGRQEE